MVLGDGELVLERWTGTVTHEELIAHERAQIRDPAIKPGAVMLVDATLARFETPLIDTACLWLGIDRDQALTRLRSIKT
jgi:hypothetical protein